MVNEAQLSLTGYVASDPRSRETSNGVPQASMRVAWTPRWIDRTSGEWSDGNTSFVTVVCWRRLAVNVATCIRRGDPVLIKGRLSVRSYEDKDGNSRLAIEVEASSIGHDLSRGVATFQRTRGEQPSSLTPAGQAAVGGPADGFGLGQAGGGFGSGQPAGGELGVLDEAAIAALLPESPPTPALVPDGETAPDEEPAPDAEPVPAGV
jgi:single-strand DNA-binding protein